MYINNILIYNYLIVGIIGFLIGIVIDYINRILPENKKFNFSDFLENLKIVDYKVCIVNAILYIATLYVFGIGETFLENLRLLEYYILIPLLISVVVIDYKLQIIPNRINLLLLELGLVFTFIFGIFNINIAIDNVLGLITGGGIFLAITLIGGVVAGKEAMGFGDVKLMGALGLFFGFRVIITITLLAFLIGAIISVVLLVLKIRKTDEYIPFGPFLVISAFIHIFISFEFIVNLLIKIFTLGLR